MFSAAAGAEVGSPFPPCHAAADAVILAPEELLAAG
jgi:hypothetical protein